MAPLTEGRGCGTVFELDREHTNHATVSESQVVSRCGIALEPVILGDNIEVE